MMSTKRSKLNESIQKNNQLHRDCSNILQRETARFANDQAQKYGIILHKNELAMSQVPEFVCNEKLKDEYIKCKRNMIGRAISL